MFGINPGAAKRLTLGAVPTVDLPHSYSKKEEKWDPWEEELPREVTRYSGETLQLNCNRKNCRYCKRPKIEQIIYSFGHTGCRRPTVPMMLNFPWGFFLKQVICHPSPDFCLFTILQICKNMSNHKIKILQNIDFCTNKIIN